jgi:hypothetical protein
MEQSYDATSAFLGAISAAIGMLAITYLEDESKWKRVAAWVWLLAWCGPPITRFWIAMVTS